MPWFCSRAPTATSASNSRTRIAEPTTSWMAPPACAAMVTPLSTCSTLWVMRALISLAADEERCASARTSLATTAKPRPCSPARAASTAAFNARMLVWKAMPSMVPMMSPMRADDALMPCMVLITCSMIFPPRSAASALSPASRVASSTVAELFLTVTAICSIAEAVSSRLAADCSVRACKSVAPLEISVLELTSASDAPRTCVTMRRSEVCISTRVCINLAASSAPQARGDVVKFPSRMALMWKATSFKPPSSTLRKLTNR